MSDNQIKFIQVIQNLDNGTIKVYKVTDLHMGDQEDPLTTIVVDGYEIIDPTPVLKI